MAGPDIAMLFVPFGPSPCSTLPAHTEPISQGYCWIWPKWSWNCRDAYMCNWFMFNVYARALHS